MPGNPDTVSPKQQRIAMLAKRSREMSFTSLAYLMDLEWLHEAYRRTRKDGAAGVDGVTADEYAADLEDNLQSLLDRAKSGAYRAPPVRRVHIPKGAGNATRPIGIPSFEDKILQRAVAMLLEPIYEQDFDPCSYGFRPGRSAHDALEAIWKQTMGHRGGWVIDVDIQQFFDSLDHTHLREFLKQRIRDGVLLRLIGKWLKAGVLEGGSVYRPDSGTPQGGVISPLLANVFLHYVLDEWFAEEVRPRLAGRSSLTRYADDALICFEQERDARRVLEVLPKRLGKYGLTVHPEKTRLVRFERPSDHDDDDDPGTFDFLGFTHYWARSRKGNWVVKRRTAGSRFSRGLRMITAWCRRHRHLPLQAQQQALSRKLLGHYSYYGLTGNAPSLSRYRYEVLCIWRRHLARRNHQGLPWWKFLRLLEHYPLPTARVVHSIYHRRVANP